MRNFATFVVALSTGLGLGLGAPAAAAPISADVFASGNSATGGTALDTGIDLAAGDRLVISVDPSDCWSAGAGNRISNANGLDGLSPAPCQPTGDFGLLSLDGETFHFGSLVGRIDGGDWFFVGMDFDAVVGSSGRLFLAYWDSNAGDNFGSIAALISVNESDGKVPAPGTMALIGLGLAGMAGLRRRRVRPPLDS